MLGLIFIGCTLISDAEIADKVGVGEAGDGDSAADDSDSGRDTDSAGDTDSAADTGSGVDTDSGGDTAGPGTDDDGDGFSEDEGDCDDENAGIKPGEVETWYDGADSDCSGGSDYDQDGDGFERGVDCDDVLAGISPDAGEVWYNGTDENCDGNDGDQDGDGECASGYAGAGCVGANDDCADDPAVLSVSLNGFPDLAAVDIYPGATETWYDGLDQDCAGGDDFDADADGYQTAEYGDESGTFGDDCDDASWVAFPGAPDAWYDGVDADCVGNSDFDADRDGFDGVDFGGDDCDDWGSGVSPVAVEVIDDHIDQDCDGGDLCNVDADGDEYYESAAITVVSADLDCDDAGEANSATGDLAGDCDDGDSGVNPGELEVCENGVDDDCDGGPGECALLDMSVSAADAVLAGDVANQYVGYNPGPAGDVNGDGYDDVVFTGDYQNGSAWLVPGGPVAGTAFAETAVIEWRGVERMDQAGVGDFDGDGYDDLATGSQAAAYLILGSASPSGGWASSGIAYSTSYNNGLSLAGGDVTGDGLDDLLVSNRAGTVWLVPGSAAPASADIYTAGSQFYSSAVGWAGHSLSARGDTDGDGLGDMLISDPQDVDAGTLAGAVYLVAGSATPSSTSLATAGTKWTGLAGDYAGLSAAIVEDVNADGYADVAVGAVQNDAAGDAAGAVYILLGPTTSSGGPLSGADAIWTGELPGDYAGTSVSGAGDTDGDGFADFLVGAYGADSSGAESGSAYLILGSSLPSSDSLGAAQATFTGVAAGDRLGLAAAGVGDFNADGLDDVLFGAYAADYTGAAYLILGTGL